MDLGCGVVKLEILGDITGGLVGAESAFEDVKLLVEFVLFCSIFSNVVFVLDDELDTSGVLSLLKSIG